MNKLMKLFLKALFRPSYWFYLFARKFIPGFKRLPHIFQEALAILLMFSTIFGSLAAFITFSPFTKKAEAAWFNDSWGYRQTIGITYSSTALTDFQVSFTLNTSTLITAGKMQSDCDDIRVTTAGGDILPHWIDGSSSQTTGCNQTGTVVWTKIPSIPGNITLYVYYGNPSAINIEDGEQVFTFYDDFESGSINTADWGSNTTCANSTQQATTTQVYKGTYGAESRQSSDCGDTIVNHSFGSTGERVMEIRFYDTSSITTAGTNMLAQIGPSIGDFSVGVNTDTSTTHYVYRNGGSYTTTGFARSTGWHKIRWVESSSAVSIYIDGSFYTTTSSNYASATALTFGSFVVAAAGFYYDSAFARKYAATEPTVGSPGSEEKGTTPVAYWKFDEGQSQAAASSGSAASPVTPAFVQSKATTTTITDDPQTPAFDTAPTPGNLIIAICTQEGTITSDFTVSDTAGNTYYTDSTNLKVHRPGSANIVIQLFYAYNIATTATFRVTCTTSNAGDLTSAAALEYSGILKIADPLDKRDTNSGTTNSGVTTATVTTTINNELKFAALGSDGSSFTANESYGSPSANWNTRAANTNANCCAPFTTADNVQTTAGSYSNSWASWATSNEDWGALIATFKPDTLGGTITGATWKTDDQCIAGKCLWYDGTNDYTRIADHTDLDFAASANFTVSAWIKRNGAASANSIILQKSNANIASTYTGYKLYMDASGDLCFDIQDGTNAVDSACTSAVDFDDDKWHFVSGVKSGTTSVTLYVDGLQRAQDGSIASTGTLANSSALLTGLDSDSSSNDWLGFIDEVKIFRDNSARTASQIQADFNARSNPEGVSSAFGANTTNMPGALSNGLIGYWKLDEASGQTKNCTAEPFTDSSGNTNHGASCPSTTGPDGGAIGKFGNAVDFDNSNDYITTGLTTAYTSFTAAVWVNADTISAVDTFVSRQSYTGSNNGFALRSASGTFQAVIQNNGSDCTSILSSGITTGTWIHAAMTYDGTTLSLYKNGVLVDSDPCTLGTNSQDFKIGAGYHGDAEWFDGKLDDVRYYNKALSAAEISQLYNWAPGPVGKWDFEENSGTSVGDTSGYSNTGTFAGSGTTRWKIGKYGNAGNFNGTDDRVTLASTTGFATGTNADWTVEAWVKLNSTATTQIFAGYGDGTTDGNSPHIGQDSGSWRASTWGSANDLSGGTVTVGAWTHIAGVADGTSLKLYANGVQVGSKTITNTPVTGGGRIGSAPNATDTNANGQIDSVRIYNYARSPGQVIEDMNAGHPAPGSPVGTPYGYWKFDEGALNRCSGGSNDACNSGNGGTTLDGGAAGSTLPSYVDGKFGKALSFGGAGANAYVDIPAFSATTGASQISWSMWVKPNSLGTNECIFCMVNNLVSGVSRAGTWAIIEGSSDSSKVKVIIPNSADKTSVAEYGETPTGTLVSGTWTHIGVVYDGTQTGNANRLVIYINGIKQTLTFNGTITATTQAADASITVNIGSDSANNASFYSGIIDELKLYTAALTADQIKLDMNRGSSQILGTLSSSQTLPQSSSAEYCIPGDGSACTAPVGRWDFEEGSGNTGYDVSGNANNGTITGAAYTKSKVGKGLNFDGNDDNVDATSGTTLDNISVKTLEAWIYPESLGESNIGKIFSKVGTGWWQVQMNGEPAINFHHSFSGTDGSWKTANGTVPLNTWSHIAITYDRTNTANVPSIYINGRSQTVTTETTPTGSADSESTGNLYLGSKSDNSENFDGTIDQVRVFNYARTAAQIAWDYNRGAPVAHWKMDECQGTTINDSSGNSNTGTLNIGGSGTYTSAGTCSVSSASTMWYNGAVGKSNYALAFDTDDDISIANESNFDFTYDKPFSYAFWVNPNITRSGGATNYYMFSKRDQTANTRGYSVIARWDGSSKTIYRVGVVSGAAAAINVDGSEDIPNNVWSHITVSYSGSGLASGLKVYINGRESPGTTTQDNLASSDITNNITPRIGSWNGASNYFNGKIDNFSFYNYSLTAAQVKTLYNDGAARFGPTTGAP